MPPPSRRLSPLHAKGILTITLFALAESVTFASAASPSWSAGSTGSGSTNGGGGGNPKQYADAVNRASHSAKTNEEAECVIQADGSSTMIGNRFMNRLSLFARNRPCAASKSSNKYYSPTSKPLDARCCRECNDCLQQVLPPSSIATLCRGGHLHAAEAVAGAVVSTPYNIPLNLWKVMFQVLLTALNVACWLIPLKSKQIAQNKLALSLANAFSGGVFLSLAFGHLIPECLHGFADGNYNEAAPFVLVLAGYLLIFFVEKVAFDAHDILHEMEHGGSSGGPHDHSHHAPLKGSQDTAAVVAATTNGSSSSATAVASAAPAAGASATGRSAVILLGALAIHSVLEMMALGLAKSFGDCALLTLSISLHQPAESIALLVAFLKSGLSESQIITYLSIFSCMGPIGVGLGMLVTSYAAPIVDSIMLAVVAGTFVYVGATEVIPEEWEDSTHKWKKFAALMSGIISILCITQYTMALGH